MITPFITQLVRVLWLAAATFAISPSVTLAGPGHDHGVSGSGNASVAAWPRFTAVSELFEVVGVLDGKKVTLYLDRYADNAPVDGARIELEAGAAKLVAERSAEGEYVAMLPTAPGTGTTPVTLTVTAGNDTDLLAGLLELHGDPVVAGVGSARWGLFLLWGTFAAALLAGIVWLARRSRRKGAAS
jgi:hypothetical protein